MILKLKYMLTGGIIDWFEGSMTKKELTDIAILKNTNGEAVKFYSSICKIENKIGDVIANITHGEEKPHTVRYFCVPNFDTCEMDLCAIAKISNNGTTYVFANNSMLLNSMSCNDYKILDVSIHE